MSRKNLGLMVVLAVVAGLAGGATSGRFLVRPATAQETINRPKVIDAEMFRVMDKDNNIRAVLTATDQDGVSLVLMGKGVGKGRQGMFLFGVAPDGSAMSLMGENGNLSAELSIQ